MVKTNDSILLDYQNSADAQTNSIKKLKTDLNNVSLSRLGLFISEIILVALVINFGFNIVFGILMVLPLFAFMYLVKRQTKLQQQLTYKEQLLWIFENEIEIIRSRRNRYNNGEAKEDENHPYVSDLDIFGPGSLYDMINRCSSATGMDLLAANLTTANEIEQILSRQEAISEIESHIQATFYFRAELISHGPEQLSMIKDKLSRQLPEELNFTHKPFLRAYVKLAPFINLVFLMLGSFMGGWTWDLLIASAIFNFAFNFFHSKQINLVYDGFSGSADVLSSFGNVVKWTENISWNSKYIKALFKQDHPESKGSQQIKALAGIIQSFDARLNMILGAILNIFLLWDLRCSVRLDNWHKSASNDLVHGLQRISDFEELISFATLKHNQPEWSFPEILPDFGFSTTEMGHPLIPENKRIPNSYALNSAPTVDIVTGSNMAGKSTFLRTVGINMVLAFAGAPVCAESLKTSVFSLVTYMRIKDSLNDQTSTFKAELNRLKMILDMISKVPDSFVLIDEMLRGTNSKDKYQGSKVFIERLISEHIPSLFATHDLQLSEMAEDYPSQVRNYHFDIQLTEGEMNFDYKLKHGACKTFNAAILLKQIGLRLKDEIV
jgi:hypothetical protein